MQFIDDAEFQIAIDIDGGGRIASLKWRDEEFTVGYRGQVHTHGWYPMAPWAGRIKDGLLTSPSKGEVQLPTYLDPPNALHGFGLSSSWQDLGSGRSMLHLPEPYGGATVEQRFEVLDDAIRWSIEYDANGCDLPAWLGMHPWFIRELANGATAELNFNPTKMLKRDDKLPTGEIIAPTPQPWDDAFTEVRGTPHIIYEDFCRIDIETDAPWWVVYTEDPEGICIEPQTAPPDAANLGITGEHYIEALFVFNPL